MVNFFGSMMIVAALAALTPSVQADDRWDCGVYRQDRLNATGRMMRIPASDEERATLNFGEDLIVRITDTDGVTKSYEGSSGGAEIRSGVLREIGVLDGENFWYASYGLEYLGIDEPSHFIVLQGDIYWPDCP